MITSNYGAMAEVAGDAACLVDPYSVDALATAMSRIAHSPEERHALIERGFAQARKFTWRATAEATRGVYQQALISQTHRLPLHQPPVSSIL